jgi:hypothetical protein
MIDDPGRGGNQVAVVPHEGLNVRTTPGSGVTAKFRHGTLLRTTGREAADAMGKTWLEVRGPDVNRTPVQGWVAADFVTAHADGREGPTGRTDFELRQLGYTPVTVKPGDTVNAIAARFGLSAKESVVLNRDNHVIDPDLIFPGDTVYLPNRSE